MTAPLTLEESLNPPTFKLWKDQIVTPGGLSTYPKTAFSWEAIWPVRAQSLRICVPYIYVVGASGASLAVTTAVISKFELAWRMTPDGSFISSGLTFVDSEYFAFGSLAANTYYHGNYDFTGVFPDGSRDASGMTGTGGLEKVIAQYQADDIDFGAPQESADALVVRKRHMVDWPVRCYGVRISGEAKVSSSYSSWPTSVEARFRFYGGVWVF